RGLERLEKPRSEAQRHYVPVPGRFTAPRTEAQRHRLTQGAARKVAQEQVPRGIGAAEFSAVDIAVAVTMLQRDLPLPARIARGYESAGAGWRAALAVHDHGPIAGQPLTPVLVAGVERALDEQASKAAAVDEEIRAQTLAALQGERFDESIRAADRYVSDMTLSAQDTARLGVAAQIAREAAGIEVQGVGELVERCIGGVYRARKSPALRSHRLDGVFLQPLGLALQQHFEPVGLKGDVAHSRAGGTKRVEIKVPRPGPLAIADAQLVGRLDLPDQVALVDAELADEVHDRRNSGLSDADRVDPRGLDQPQRDAHPDQ